VEPHGDDVVVCDGRGLTRVIGEPVVIANEMRRMAWDRGVGVRVAIAGSQTAAWLLAHVRPGITVVTPGEEAKVLARLPLTALTMLPECQDPPRPPTTKRSRGRGGLRDVLGTLDRWGMVTLGDLARLSRADITSRLGLAGARLHQAAWGEDAVPMVATAEAPRFCERVELEWPVDGLEPLSFVLARVCDALSGALERADRGAVTITTRLTLASKAAYERTLTLPAPMRDAKVLRTLILLDLEAHPPETGLGIDVVEVELGVTPGRIVQKSLLAHDVPAVEDIATLVARLQSLMGESRVGAPVVLDTHDPRKSSLKPFSAPASALRATAGQAHKHSSTRAPGHKSTVVRRFRHPMPVRVTADRGIPLRLGPTSSIQSQSKGGRVVHRAGPWRTSGQWWTADRDTWDRDEWDVAVDSGVVYRLSRDRTTDRWEVEGVID
jgi:protein ImuB